MHGHLRSGTSGVNQCQMIQFSHCRDMSGLSCQVSHQEYQLEFIPALLQGQLPEIRAMTSRFNKQLSRHADIYATRTSPLHALTALAHLSLCSSNKALRHASTTTLEHTQARHVIATSTGICGMPARQPYHDSHQT